MSKQNEVRIYGILSEVISGDDSVSASVYTIRRKSGKVTGEVDTFSDEILIFTKDKDKIKLLKSINEGSAVEIYGSFVTRHVKASLTCQNCGNEIETMTTIAYVNPTAINAYKVEGQRREYLKNLQEKSNSITLMGRVIKEPFPLNDKTEKISEDGEIYFEPVDSKETVFPMSISRNFPLLEDPLGKNDYPLIAAKTLESELEDIKEGSNIMIRGSIWSKPTNRTIKCRNCKHTNKFEDSTTLIFPFTVEYLFSQRKECALGTLIGITDAHLIIMQDGELLCEIKDKTLLEQDTYREIRKELYPKLIKSVCVPRKGQIEVEVYDKLIKETLPVINIIVGGPKTGKSTFAKKFAERRLKTKVFSLGETNEELNKNFEEIRETLKNGDSVIIDAPHTTTSQRTTTIKRCGTTSALKIAHVLDDTDVETDRFDEVIFYDNHKNIIDRVVNNPMT